MADLPKEELLRKMLNMTTSDNDGQALVAIRKANKLLADAGWSWDKLLAGKIRIVESPFANVPNPSRPSQVEQPQSPVTPRQKPSRPLQSPGVGMMWQWNAWDGRWEAVSDPSYAPPKPKPSGLGLTRSNLYARYCYCCGDYVANNAGFIMKPRDFNFGAKDKWEIVCAPCNAKVAPSSVRSSPAPRNTGQTTVTAPAPNLGNL